MSPIEVRSPALVVFHLPRQGADPDLHAAAGIPAAHHVQHEPGLDLLRLAPDRCLAISGDPELTGPGLAERLARRAAAVTDVTGHQLTLRLRGPDAVATLAAGCPVDLRPSRFAPGQCRSAPLARVPIVLVRHDLDDFELVIPTAWRRFLTQWLGETRCAPLDLPDPDRRTTGQRPAPTAVATERTTIHRD